MSSQAGTIGISGNGIEARRVAVIGDESPIAAACMEALRGEGALPLRLSWERPLPAEFHAAVIVETAAPPFGAVGSDGKALDALYGTATAFAAKQASIVVVVPELSVTGVRQTVRVAAQCGALVHASGSSVAMPRSEGCGRGR